MKCKILPLLINIYHLQKYLLMMKSTLYCKSILLHLFTFNIYIVLVFKMTVVIYQQYIISRWGLRKSDILFKPFQCHVYYNLQLFMFKKLKTKQINIISISWNCNVIIRQWKKLFSIHNDYLGRGIYKVKIHTFIHRHNKCK